MEKWKYGVVIVTFIAVFCVQNNVVQATPGDDCTAANCTEPTEYCDGAQCQTNINLGDNCTLDTPCLTDNASCQDEVCSCTDTFYNDTNMCLPKINLGSNCTDDAHCLTGNASCHSDVCSCDNGFYNTSDSCLPKVNLGGNCTDDTHCLTGNASCHNDVCSCDNGFYNTTDSCLPKANLGGNCTDDTHCLTGNASCPSDVCSCDNGFYNTSDSCLPKANLGGNCTDDTHCLTGNASCHSDVCSCDNGFYNTSDSCLPKVNLGGNCADDTHCLTGNASCHSDVCSCDNGFYNTSDSCLPNCASCQSDVCSCNNGFYNTSDSCLPKINLGENCNDTTPCLTDNASCQTNVCSCSDVYYEDEMSCHIRVGLGYNCTSDIHCLTDNTSCKNGVCSCSTGFYSNTDSCLPKVAFSGDCTGISDQCQSPLGCFADRCFCPENTNYDGNDCSPSSNLKKSLTVDSTTKDSITVIVSWDGQDASATYYNTTYYLLYSSTSFGTISPPTKTFTIPSLNVGTEYSLTVLTQIIENVNGNTRQSQSVTSDGQPGRTRQVYAGYCSATILCEAMDGLFCESTTTKCLCRDTYFWDGSKCSTGTNYTPVISATPSFTTIDVSWSSTPATYYTSTLELRWTPNDGVFTATGQTSYRIEGLVQGQTYTILLTRVMEAHGRSRNLTAAVSQITENGYGGDCSSIVCIGAVGLICEPTTSKCLCGDSYFWTGSQCSQAPDYRPSFDPPTIGVNFIYIQWTALDTQYYTSSYLLSWSPAGVVGGSNPITITTKNHRIDGLSQGTEYTITLTRTITAEGRSRFLTPQTTTYTTKIAYGQPCTATTNLCYDDRTNCYSDTSSTSTCRCDPTYFRSTDSCETIDTLKPSSVPALTMRSTTSLIVTWTGQDNNVITGYEVSATPTETTASVDVTGKTATISGLTPGRNYTVEVKTKITYLTGRDETTTATSDKMRTKPEKVQDIINDIWISPDITISFRNPNGDLDSYIVKLQSTGYSQTHQPPKTVNISTATFTGVSPNVVYRLEIETNSGGILSDVFNTSIRTKAQSEVKVRDLVIYNRTSRTAQVSWKRPSPPKGNIYQYILRLTIGGECKRLFIFNCTTCSTTRSNETEPSCIEREVVPIPEEAVSSDDFTVSYTMTHLLPATTYLAKVSAVNQEGMGEESSFEFSTEIEAAGEPTSFSSPSQTSGSITLTWTPPVPRPGPTSYNVTAYEYNDQTKTYDYFGSKQLPDYTNSTATLSNMSSFWKYNFTIRATTGIGSSSLVSIGPVTTEESAPVQVVSMEVEPTDKFNKIRVSWECPPQKDGRNGVIQTAHLTWEPEGTSVENRGRGSEVLPNEDNCVWKKEITVTPEYNYTISVFLKNTLDGEIRSEKRYIAPGPPPAENIILQDGETTPGRTSAPIRINPMKLYDGMYGRVTLTGIIVCPSGQCQQRKRRAVMTEDHYGRLDNWVDSQDGGFTTDYRATPQDWIADKRDRTEVEFKLGEETECDAETAGRYCNGPLPSGRKILVIVFSCTQAGCTESSTLEVTTEAIEPPSNLPVIIGVVVAVAVALVVAIVVIMFIRKRRHTPARKLENIEEIEPEPLIQTKRPIRICEFKERVEKMHKDSNLLFSEEFEDISTLSAKHACTASETGGNKLKNRYVNILPFDHSRVKLVSLEDDEEETDYINANYIPGYNSLREYIATQGPMTGTVNDFWRLIWEQNVPIIVMLSDLSEKGKPKVDRYYPETQEPVSYGDVVCEMTNYSPLSKYIIRIFKLSVGDETRMVRHYFLPGWQDFGANLTSDDVINFVKSVRMEVKPDNKGPLCVHCSAGVGRTGTYISLDVFQQYIDEENMKKEMDIFAFVLKMRQNRSYMVQTEKQYIFVHDTIKEMIDRKMKEMAEREKDPIYQNSEDNVYANQAFEPDADVDVQDIYMNVDATGKPTTVL